MYKWIGILVLVALCFVVSDAREDVSKSFGCIECDKENTSEDSTSIILASGVASTFISSHYRCYTCWKSGCIAWRKGKCIRYGMKAGTCCT